MSAPSGFDAGRGGFRLGVRLGRVLCNAVPGGLAAGFAGGPTRESIPRGPLSSGAGAFEWRLGRPARRGAMGSRCRLSFRPPGIRAPNHRGRPPMPWGRVVSVDSTAPRFECRRQTGPDRIETGHLGLSLSSRVGSGCQDRSAAGDSRLGTVRQRTSARLPARCKRARPPEIRTRRRDPTVLVVYQDASRDTLLIPSLRCRIRGR